MKTDTISRQEELCQALNFNFDEACELFSEETLESMQMAKVNGGEPITLTALGVAFVVGVASGLVSAWIYDKLTSTASNGPTAMNGFKFDADGLKYDGKKIDSLKMWVDGREFSWTDKPVSGPSSQPSPTSH